jgi:hypothetical protein
MIRNGLVFRVSRRVTGQVNQISRHGLPDLGAGFAWITVRVEQVLQVDQPLPLPTIALDLIGKGLATAGQDDQAAQQDVVPFF